MARCEEYNHLRDVVNAAKPSNWAMGDIIVSPALTEISVHLRTCEVCLADEASRYKIALEQSELRAAEAAAREKAERATYLEQQRNACPHIKEFWAFVEARDYLKIDENCCCTTDIVCTLCGETSVLQDSRDF